MTATLIRRAGALDVVERRSLLEPTAATIVRAAADSEPRFVGSAIVYDSRTSIGNPLGWGWFEEMAPGCATKSCGEFDQRMLVDHDTAKVVARRSVGDLRLDPAAAGNRLGVDADLDQRLSYVADLVLNLEARRITGMSFGFRVVRDAWTTETITAQDAKGNPVEAEVDVRRIEEIQLLEVSAVTFPAYEDTDAGLRALAAEVRSARGLPLTRGATDAAGPAPDQPTRDARPAPGDGTTRGDDAAPLEEGTRRSVRLMALDAAALAARYGLR